MRIPPLDQQLSDLLGPAAGVALTEWSGMMGLSFTLDRMLVNGRSGATVASVYEHSHDDAQRLILKHDFVDDQENEKAEYARHTTALAQAPHGFGPAHLSALAHEPIRVGDGTWITFQHVVGGGPQPYHVMTSLLAGDSTANIDGLSVEPVACPRSEFVNVCMDVVDAILSGWAEKPLLELVSASDFIRRHLRYRATPGRPLYQLSRNWTMQRVKFPGEPVELPNPFAFALDLPAALDVRVPAILGRAHGDLHTENILVSQDHSIFALIDLARYELDAPLTRDPLHLVFSVVNRAIDELTDAHLRVLLDAFTRPSELVAWDQLPEWLSALVQGTHQVALRWIGQRGLGEEWRRVMPLSTVAVALMFAARPTTTERGRAWFVHLAARATHVFMQVREVGNMTTASPADPAVRMPADGLADLCRDLRRKRQLARAGGVEPELDQLIMRARLGHPIEAEYQNLMNQIGYGGNSSRGSARRPIHDIDLPGDGIGQPVMEVFRCPMPNPCTRADFRGPHGEPPYCFVRNGIMTSSVA